MEQIDRKQPIESRIETHLWPQMERDAKMMFGVIPFIEDKYTKIAEFENEYTPFEKIRGVSSSSYRAETPIKITFTVEQLVGMYLPALFGSYVGSFTPLINELKITTGDPDPRCQMTTEPKKSKKLFEVFVDDPNHHFAQEEMLHAAQELLFGHDSNDKWYSGKTTEQLVHTSFAMDMAMSLAALQEGTWSEWNRKANELQTKHKKQYSDPRDAQRTLLGTSINKRFQYYDMSVEQVGLYWRNLGKYFDSMFGTPGTPPNEIMEQAFEFGCLAYGANHRNLSFSFVDLPVEPTDNDYQAGLVVIDWAKRVLKNAAELGVEEEILSHHSDMRQIPDDYFSYQVPETVLQQFRINGGTMHFPLVSLVNVHTLRQIWQGNKLEAITEITSAYEESKKAGDNSNLYAVLRSHGVSPNDFNLLIRKAEEALKQFEATEIPTVSSIKNSKNIYTDKIMIE